MHTIRDRYFSSCGSPLLCCCMLQPKVVRADKTKLTFRAVLLTMCQKEFEKNIPVEGYSDKKRRELEGASVVCFHCILQGLWVGIAV